MLQAQNTTMMKRIRMFQVRLNVGLMVIEMGKIIHSITKGMTNAKLKVINTIMLS
jgi:hypothetical protein